MFGAYRCLVHIDALWMDNTHCSSIKVMHTNPSHQGGLIVDGSRWMLEGCVAESGSILGNIWG